MKTIYWLPLAALGLLVVGCSSKDDYGASADSVAYSSAEADSGYIAGSSPQYEDKAGFDGAAPRNGAIPPGLTSMSTTSMTQQQRQIIRHGEISLRVEDVRKAARKITDMVVTGGGYVESSNTSGVAGDDPQVDMTIRVVSHGYDDAMMKLEDMGVLLSQSSDTNDVTAQLVDLGVRVKTLTAKEDTFREMLRQSRNTNDIITLQNRLTEVRTEIERMEAQRKSLSQLASLSTIKVHLTQNATLPVVAQDPNWFGETFASTSTSFMGSLRGVVGVLLWIVVYAPFWGIPLFLGIWIKKKYGRQVTTTPTH